MLESSSARILPPPGRIGRMGVRETVAYFKDQNKFIENRVKEHGPVFKTGLFFRPTVLIGSKEAVQDFKKIEPYITESSLPPGFVKLHTPYSALNQKGAQLRACRAAYQQVLGNKAILAYFPVIKECLEEAVASIPAGTRDNPSTLNLMEQIRPSLFNVFFQLFAGRPSNKERERLFTEFNNGLLAVLDWDLPWTDYGKARRARDKLIADVKSLFDQKDAQTGRNEPLNPAFQYFIDTLSEARDEHGEIWSRERIATVAILFIWGAFEETAASVSNTLRLISQKPEIVLKIREELARVAPNGVKEMSLRDFGSLKYLDACLSESLRLVPPSGGGMRMATEDVELCGYHIPKGWVISADPRISNKLKENFGEDIDDFNPSRFVQREFSAGEFFPGGFGSHSCPGISLAKIVSMMYIAGFVERFETWSQVPDSEIQWRYVPFTVMTDYPVNLVRAAPAAPQV